MKLKMFSADEIEQMAACEITDFKITDAIGRSFVGGLDDVRMGPTM